ncbi:MAG TPA: M12 family metallopeptidase [Verrucomicrobiae bacterium]|nr:M12 family metallopeptidase [Verrucomicrobiae bacterium]
MPYLLWLLPLLFFFASLDSSRAGNFYSGISPATVPWPGGIVPYEFTNTLTADQEQTYLNGLREWELAANVKFVPHTTQANWILFCYNTNFQDYVSGGSYSPQIVTVSSLSRAQVCHEMGHSFGFTHENIRPDATSYILVLTNNISNEPTNIYWFTIDPTSVTNGKYDYESVMHLGWDFDSTNPGVLATQMPKAPNFPRYQYRMGNYCLSPGDRAALAYLYGPPAVPLTNVVTTTADAGAGSLRAALYFVTDHPGSVVTFNIPTSDSSYSNGVFNIHLTGMLPPLVSNGMVIDGSTQPGFAGKPLIMVDGSQILPETYTSDTGLLVYSSSNQVRDISFSGFNWNGLTFTYADASNNVVSGCWIGVDSTGTNPAPNAYQGILVTSGSGHNTFGGATASSRNVVSGNSQYGIYIGGTNTGGNVIEGNYIGTDPSGSIAVPNGLSGIFIGDGTMGNVINGNVLSGNIGYGIFMTNTMGNVISNNDIGLSAGGEAALQNSMSGIGVFTGVESNSIGPRNVISGNPQYGIEIGGPNAGNNVVFGDHIGTDAAGTNSPGVQPIGIGIVGGASGNIIGGTAASARNVLSGNTTYGVYISDPGTSSNIVLGNLIGTDVTGTKALPNGGWGIGVWSGASGNMIGGTFAGAGNVISGSTGAGYGIAIGGANSNVVEGNFIGTDISGKAAIPNGFAGVAVENGAVGNLIGETNAGAGNVIDYNYIGVAVYQSNTTNDAIRGNSIYANTWEGIDLDGFPGNHVGFEAGPDDWQNYPVITNAFGYAGSTIIQGNFNSLPNDAYYIDFYANLADGPSGYGEGQVFIGTAFVTTNGAGNALFAFTNNSANYSGQYISATATAATGDSSQFAADVLATNAPAPSAQFGASFRWAPNGFVFNLTFATNFSYHIQAATNLAANPVPWLNLTNFTATNISVTFTDRAATAYRARFYRVVSP